MGPSEAASMLGVGRRAGTDCVCTALPATCSEGVAALEETGGGTCMLHLLQGRTVNVGTALRDLPKPEHLKFSNFMQIASQILNTAPGVAASGYLQVRAADVPGFTWQPYTCCICHES